MPDLRTRRLLLLAGLLGLLFACAGLVGVVQARTLADVGGPRLLLFGAWLILMPLFIYVMRLRGRARRMARALALERKQALDTEADRLRTPEGIRAIGGEDNPPVPPSP